MHNFEPNTDCRFFFFLNCQTQYRANLPPAKLTRSISMVTSRVHESHHRSHLCVVATLVLLVHQMAKRSQPFPDEASKDTGAPSKSKLAGKSVLALAADRHEKSSPLSVAHERMQSDVEGQENPGQASGDRLHLPCFTRIFRVTEPEASHLEVLLLDATNRATCFVPICTQRVP